MTSFLYMNWKLVVTLEGETFLFIMLYFYFSNSSNIIVTLPDPIASSNFEGSSILPILV